MQLQYGSQKHADDRRAPSGNFSLVVGKLFRNKKIFFLRQIKFTIEHNTACGKSQRKTGTF